MPAVFRPAPIRRAPWPRSTSIPEIRRHHRLRPPGSRMPDSRRRPVHRLFGQPLSGPELRSDSDPPNSRHPNRRPHPSPRPAFCRLFGLALRLRERWRSIRPKRENSRACAGDRRSFRMRVRLRRRYPWEAGHMGCTWRCRGFSPTRARPLAVWCPCGAYTCRLEWLQP